MGTSHKDYNFADGVKLVIGNVLVGGYASDGGVEYEFASSIYEDESGADGQVTVSQTHDYRMYANITLKETSKSYKDLYALLLAQEAQLRKINLPFVHKDLINGDSIAVGTCIFMDRPTPSKNRTAGDRVFRILLPDGAKRFKAALLNLTP